MVSQCTKSLANSCSQQIDKNNTVPESKENLVVFETVEKTITKTIETKRTIIIRNAGVKILTTIVVNSSNLLDSPITHWQPMKSAINVIN